MLAAVAALAHAAEPPLEQQALAAMKKATACFTSTVATRGGYLWKYSADLKKREGEGKATATQIWVQPPGTPSVGLAYVRAYQATGDKQFLDAAVAAARALVWGQLRSGGWHYHIDFDPKRARRYAYRHPRSGGSPTGRNTSTLDDNNTQAALRLLMAVDPLVKDDAIHEAVTYGLNALLKAQLPKGGWAQRFFLAPPKAQRYATTVRIALDGQRTEIKRPAHYAHYYTFNDNTINDCIAVCLEAYERYKEKRFLDAARRAGDFIILSQLKPPQTGWAQQYTLDLKPEWARRFEPPAVCSAVTSRNIYTLIEIWVATGDEKYLKPIPAALDWLKRSRLPGKEPRWARFYELGTNRPLYFTKGKYELTYKPDNLPTHYAFIVRGDHYGKPKARYERARKQGRQAILAQRRRKPTAAEQRKRARALEREVRKIIAALDAQGRWLDDGWIQCRTFIRNVRVLADYVGASGAARGPAKRVRAPML